MGRAVVTGGCGFIGGHLVARLLNEGFEVRVLDNFANPSVETLREFPPDVEIRRVDVRDLNLVEKFIRGADVVFHLAALIDVVESERRKKEYWDVNVAGTKNVLEAALKNGADVVLASSAAVYGELKEPAREDLRPRPLSFYGLTKLEAERLCKEYFEQGLQVSILRLFNVFGERARSGVVKIFLERAARGEPLVVYGDGKSVRDFVYVGDVADAFLKAWEKEASRGEIINIGSGKPVKIGELANHISKRVGVEVRYLPEREGEIRFSLADISKAIRLLDWRPRLYLFDWVEERLVKI